MDSHDWDGRYAASDLVWSATPNQFVEAFALTLTPGTALDFAGGEGRNALWLAARGWQVTLLDFSRVALERAEGLAAQRLGPGSSAALTTVEADAVTYRPPREGFDLVVVAYLQLPASLRRPALAAAASAVAAGGNLLVVAHDSSNLHDGYGGPQDADVLYTAEDAAADIANAALTISQAGPVERVVSVDGGTRTAIDALLLAHRPEDQ